MILTDQNARIHVQVQGVPLDGLPWRTYEGGDIESSTTNERPAGMEPAVAFPGPRQRTNATVTRWYSTDVLHPLLRPLEQAAGRKKITISWTPLDGDGNPMSSTFIETGIVKNVTHPNFSANDGAVVLLTLVGEMDELATTVNT